MIQTCLLAVLLALPARAQAQFINTTNNGTITITGYTGPGGAVTIPDTINGLPVTSIGDEAFVNNTSLTSVTIPNSVTNIGEGAFSGCYTVTSMTIPDSVISIGYGAFEYTGLTSVTIPDSVTTIGGMMFFFCSNLASVTIGNSVTRVGELAFNLCSSLTSMTIPDNVTDIGENTFAFCTSLTNVTIGNSVTNIGDYAFDGCDSLATVTKGASVTRIESGAFGGNRPISVYFKGNAPVVDGSVFANSYGFTFAKAYYLPGTTGWTDFSASTGVGAGLWNPLIQTGGANFGVRTNQFGFNIAWAAGQTVVVEACANLANPIWIPAVTNVLPADTSYFSDPQWTNYPARYYRLKQP